MSNPLIEKSFMAFANMVVLKSGRKFSAVENRLTDFAQFELSRGIAPVPSTARALC
jgi:hypothetical protein